MSARKLGPLDALIAMNETDAAITAAATLPLRLCDACEYKALPAPTADGWCYMFRAEPCGAYCAQFKATAKARRG